MAGLLFGFLLTAISVHAIGVGFIKASGRPTGKRVWVTLLALVIVSIGLWTANALGSTPARTCAGDCGLLALGQGLILMAVLSGLLLGSITMAIHGAVAVSRFNEKFGPARLA